jgi:hypothetical protein
MIVKDNLDGFTGHATLIKSKDGNFYVVSSVSNEFATETMVFKSDENGNIDDWMDLWCAKGIGHHQEGIDVAIEGNFGDIEW